MSRKRLTGVFILTAVVLYVLITPLVLHDEGIVISRQLEAPSSTHPFGFDALGRDLLLRTAQGGRVSLFIGLTVSLLTIAVSLLISALALSSKLADEVIMRLCDVVMAIPSTLLAILLMVVFGQGAGNIVITLVIVNIPATVRLIRSRAMVILSSDFIKAREELGIRTWRIMTGSLLPHLMPLLLVRFSYLFSASVLAEAGLSFIGAGIAAPAASWGGIIADGRSAFLSAPWVLFFPSLLLFLTTASVNFITSEGSILTEKA